MKAAVAVALSALLLLSSSQLARAEKPRGAPAAPNASLGAMSKRNNAIITWGGFATVTTPKGVLNSRDA
jgi:hypothetical protein